MNENDLKKLSADELCDLANALIREIQEMGTEQKAISEGEVEKLPAVAKRRTKPGKIKKIKK